MFCQVTKRSGFDWIVSFVSSYRPQNLLTQRNCNQLFVAAGIAPLTGSEQMFCPAATKSPRGIARSFSFQCCYGTFS